MNKTLQAFIDSGADSDFLDEDLAAKLKIPLVPLLLWKRDQRLVLGSTWLRRHNPHVIWSMGEIVGWCVTCLSSCLRAATSPSIPESPEEEFPDLSKVPEL